MRTSLSNGLIISSNSRNHLFKISCCKFLGEDSISCRCCCASTDWLKKEVITIPNKTITEKWYGFVRRGVDSLFVFIIVSLEMLMTWLCLLILASYFPWVLEKEVLGKKRWQWQMTDKKVLRVISSFLRCFLQLQVMMSTTEVCLSWLLQKFLYKILSIRTKGYWFLCLALLLRFSVNDVSAMTTSLRYRLNDSESSFSADDEETSSIT